MLTLTAHLQNDTGVGRRSYGTIVVGVLPSAMHRFGLPRSQSECAKTWFGFFDHRFQYGVIGMIFDMRVTL